MKRLACERVISVESHVRVRDFRDEHDALFFIEADLEMIADNDVLFRDLVAGNRHFEAWVAVAVSFRRRHGDVPAFAVFHSLNDRNQPRDQRFTAFEIVHGFVALG